MPITPERLLQIAKSKGIDTSQYEAKITQTAQPPQNDLASQLETLKSSGLLNSDKGIRGGIADAMFYAGGKTPPASYGGLGDSGIGKMVLGKVLDEELKNPVDREIDRDYKRAATDYRRAGLEGSDTQRTSDINQKANIDFKSGQDVKNRSFDFRKEFLSNQPVQQFHEMLGKGQQIDGVLTKYFTDKSKGDMKSAQFTDQALITLLNKILDPLSVVRESEYARSQEGQTIINRASGLMDKLFTQGGAGLTDQDRIELARVAQTLVNGAGETFNKFYDAGVKSSQQWGLDPELVMSGYSKYQPSELKDYSMYIQGPQNNSKVVVPGNVGIVSSGLSDEEAYQEYLRIKGKK